MIFFHIRSLVDEDLKSYADEWFEIQKNIKSKKFNKNKNYDKKRKEKKF